MCAACSRSAVCRGKRGVSWQDVPFVGVGCPGSINPQTGTVAFSPNLFCQDFPLQAMLEAKLKKPVFVENDANAAALGEWYAGALQGAEHALAITLGTGVGCGILIHGKLYRGSNFAAGEMGHMVIQAGGRPCHCGRKGCWERYASATGLKQTTREFLLQTTPATAPILWDTIEGDPKNIGGRTAFEAMRAGDPVGKAIVEQYLEHLGCGWSMPSIFLSPISYVLAEGYPMKAKLFCSPCRIISAANNIRQPGKRQKSAWPNSETTPA